MSRSATQCRNERVTLDLIKERCEQEARTVQLDAGSSTAQERFLAKYILKLIYDCDHAFDAVRQ